MNKYLLITGIGILFLSTAFAQHKVNYTIPRSVLMPFPAATTMSTVSDLHIDDHLFRTDGQLIGFTATGDTLFVGGWKRDQLQGNWSSWYNAERVLDSGRLEKAVPDGVWKSWYPDGSLRTIRTYHATKLTSVKNEIRRRNARNTFFVITDIAKQNVAAARHLLTPAYSYHSLDHSHAGQQSASLQKRVSFNVQQSAYLPPFTECLQHGLYMNFFPGGDVKDSGYYKNGVRDGLWKEWNADASILATGMYKRGRPQGDWKFYNKEGKLLYIQLYNDRGKLKDKIRLQ